MKLLEDILKIAKDQGRPCHFIGSVIYLARDNAQHAAALKEYLVIDGQQRLTTVSIILLALGDYTRERFGDGEEYSRSATNLEKLSKRYIINEDEPVQSDTYYKIRLNAEDFLAWKKLISDRKKPDEIRRSKIFENYDILMKALRESGAEPQLVYDGIKKLRLVDICLVPEDNAQLVFETVNSTGLPLTTADKIRNFLLMTVDADTQSQLYTDYWHPMELDLGMESGSTATFESFFYYYMTVMLQKQLSGDYYDLFKDYYFDNKVQGTAAIVKQIRQYSKYFIQWQTAKEDGNRIHCLLCRIRGAGQWKFTPAVLKLLADWNDGLISEADTEEILTIMESYLMRRAVCAFPTNTAGPVSLSMLKSLFPPARTEDLARFDHLKFFKRNISLLTWAQRMPKDDEVIKILQTLPVYSNNSSRTKMLLDKLENYGQKQSTHVASYTIEHPLDDFVLCFFCVCEHILPPLCQPPELDRVVLAELTVNHAVDGLPISAAQTTSNLVWHGDSAAIGNGAVDFRQARHERIVVRVPGLIISVPVLGEHIDDNLAIGQNVLRSPQISATFFADILVLLESLRELAPHYFGNAAPHTAPAVHLMADVSGLCGEQVAINYFNGHQNRPPWRFCRTSFRE